MQEKGGGMPQQYSWQAALAMPPGYQVHQNQMQYGPYPGQGSHSGSAQSAPSLPQHGLIGQGSLPTLDAQSSAGTGISTFRK
jgi:hypothetical protein